MSRPAQTFEDRLNAWLCDATVAEIIAARDRMALAIMLKSGGPPAAAKRTRKAKPEAQLPLTKGESG